MKRAIGLTVFVLMILALNLQAYGASGKEVYDKVCAFCHKSGKLTAPKMGDKAAWAPRIAEGTDKLYESALNGYGMMPARGGEKNLTDDEVRSGVDYIIENSK